MAIRQHLQPIIELSRAASILRTALLILTVLSVSDPAAGQRNEFGFLFGGSYYMGDLNPATQFSMARVAAGGLYRHNVNSHLSLRANVLYGEVEGNDAITRYQPLRDLRFESRIMEASGQLEINFIPYMPGNPATPVTTYVFFGGGGFYFDPVLNEPGQGGELVSLRLAEDHPEAAQGGGGYQPWSYSLLFGMGVKFNITRYISGGLEWGLRRTGTDYLDDVKYRGNPKNKDWYSFAGFILTFKFTDESPAICPYYD
jgi:hypothetical protein